MFLSDSEIRKVVDNKAVQIKSNNTVFSLSLMNSKRKAIKV